VWCTDRYTNTDPHIYTHTDGHTHINSNTHCLKYPYANGDAKWDLVVEL
jgi:hypothetical protein